MPSSGFFGKLISAAGRFRACFVSNVIKLMENVAFYTLKGRVCVYFTGYVFPL